VSPSAGGILIFALLIVAAFLALSEVAVSRISRVKAHQLQQDGRKGSDALLEIVEDPAPYLTVVLLLTLIAHITATAAATSIALDRYGGGAEAIAAGLMTFLIFVFAEMTPKTFAVQRTERAALLMARPIRSIGRLLSPLTRALVWLANLVSMLVPGSRRMPKGPFVTEEEIRQMVDVAEEEEEIEEDERELIHSVFEFGDAIVREVMVPRTDMIAVRSGTGFAEALELIIEAGFSRLPIYEGDLDNVVGLLYAKDLMRRMHESGPEGRVEALGRAPTFVPEQKRLMELLREMQEQHVHMAIVVDEYGGTAGLVTIEDLIEEIVGEIVDEFDREEPLVEPIDDETLRVDAKISIDEVNDLLGVDLPHEEWDTVGGLVFGLTGRVPIVGETVRFDGLQFTTERVTGRRIQKIVIRKVGPAGTSG
jgi:CBS domain containing-hemolysin-like protein